MKTYIKPEFVILKAAAESLLTTESIPTGTPGANPSDALAPGFNGILEEDEE